MWNQNPTTVQRGNTLCWKRFHRDLYPKTFFRWILSISHVSATWKIFICCSRWARGPEFTTSYRFRFNDATLVGQWSTAVRTPPWSYWTVAPRLLSIRILWKGMVNCEWWIDLELVSEHIALKNRPAMEHQFFFCSCFSMFQSFHGSLLVLRWP